MSFSELNLQKNGTCMKSKSSADSIITNREQPCLNIGL